MNDTMPKIALLSRNRKYQSIADCQRNSLSQRLRRIDRLDGAERGVRS